MKKKIFNGLASLILPLGAYAGVAPAGGYHPNLRSYLRAGQANGMPLETARISLGGANEATLAGEHDELAVVHGQAVRELMVIDAAVPDKHIFYREAKPGVEIIEIDSSLPGLDQLVEELGHYKNLSALHIVSHAEDGVLLLGNSRITAENIKHEIEAFAALNGALREGGDLLLYGCDLAKSEAGTELLDIVQRSTHLDLAASSNLTGDNTKTADWDLEIQRGEIESNLPFSAKATADFSHVLAGTFTLSDNTVFTYRAGGETVGEVKLGATVTDNCPNAGKTYYYHSVDSTDYIGCGFMHNNGYGGTIVGLVNYYGSAYTPAFFKADAPGTVPYADDSGTNHIEIRHRNDTNAFQLTNVVADEFSGSTTFSDVWITGYVEGGGTITSGHITTDSGTPTTFTFDSADELSNFAGVNLTKFRLSFINQTGSSVDYMRLVSFTTAPPNAAPTLTTINTLNGATEDTPFSISYADLAAAANEADGDGDTLAFRVEAVSTGTVAKGGVAVTAGATLLSSGETLVWTPATNASGTLNAFTVKAWDGAVASSSAEQVQVDVTAVEDAPTATGLPSDVTVSEDTASNFDLSAVTFADAEGNSLTITLAAGAGTFAATTGGGVTVSGSGSGTLSLAGTAADVNTFLDTASNIQYTGAANTWGNDATTVTVNANDGTTDPVLGTINVDISAINDAPIGSNLTQTVAYTEDPGGNVALGDIVVSDVDAGETITATLTLSDLSAGSLTTGSYGAATSTFNAGTGVWTVTGSTADVNAALAAVAFTPAEDYDQDATITNRIRDAAGTGPADGTITLDVTAVNDAPTDIALSDNDILQSATSAGADIGTLSSTDVDDSSFTHSLVATGAAANGTCTADSDNSSFQVNGTTLEAASALAAGSYNLCVQTHDGTTSFEKTLAVSVTDDVAPTVSSVNVPADATYIAGQTLGFTVNTTENVTVNTTGGTPRIALTIGATTRYATYASGSGTSALVFSYSVQAGDNDADGVAVGALDLNGGTLRDAASNNLNLTLNSVGSTAGVLVDTAAPTATIVLADIALAVGETSGVTITFSEAVTGFTNADLTIANGTLSAVSSADGGSTWTATLTPASGVSDATNVIALDNTGVTDAAGNAGTGTTDSNNYVIDTEVPVATIVVADTELNLGETSLVTITFNAAVTGFTNADLTVGNGSLSAVSSADGGITWTATFTPAADTDEPSNVITLDNTGVVDASGNAGTGTTDSNNFAIRTLPITLLVTTNLDTGDDATAAASLAEDQTDGGGLSLREALAWARTGDTITFDLDSGTAGNQGGTITLNGNLLTISYSNLNIDGDLDNDGTADVTISANNASRVMLINNSLSGIEITGLTLTQGTVTGGGAGLYIGSGSSVTVRDSNITNNAETSLGGGGVYGSGATLTMINSTVSGNSSSAFGGGIRIVGAGGTLNLINSTVSGNTTTGIGAHGGGIQYGGSGALTIVNSTISGNTIAGASSLGGGLRITSGISYIYNATIVGNAATGGGGGVYANGTDTFVNVVVAGNTSGAGAMAGLSGSPLATGGVADDVGGTVETATNSYFGTAATITTNNGSFNNLGTASLLLGNLGDNGGQVLTHQPQSGSALINAGSDAALPADTYDLDGDSDTTEALPFDAVGGNRIAGSAVDIGAKEANTPPVLTSFNGGGIYIENGAAVIIDNDASISDAELDVLNGGNGDYNSASLLVARNGGAVISDVFGFSDGNGISLSGSDLLKNGQIIAGFDTSTAGQVTINFTNANGETPTQADVEAILRQITYSSSSQDPGTSASLDITVTDDAGGSATATANLVIDPNDPPSLSGTAPTSATAGLLYSFTPEVSDPDTGDELSFSASGLPAWLTLNTETGRISGTPADADVDSHSSIQLSVSDGSDYVSLPAFNIVVEPGQDTDDDTVSDYQEGLDGTDPSDSNDYWDVTPPVLTAPEAVTLDAMALYTPVHLKQLLGLPLTASASEFGVALAALATDNIDGDGCCDPTVDELLFGSFVLLPPGRNEVIWMIEDRKGNTAEIAQVVNLRPLVSMSKDQTTVEGTTVSFDIVLNGESPVYPLTVPYVLDSASTVTEADHTLVDGSVTFIEEDGVGQTRARVSVDITSDDISEDDKTLVVRLDDHTSHLEDLDEYDPANPDIYDINAGATTRHSIHIVEGNLPPDASLQLTQGGRHTVFVTPAGGPVTATVQATDANPGDTATLDWSESHNTLVDSDGDTVNETLVFDSSGLLPGRHKVQVQVTDSEGATSTARLFFRVVVDLPVLESGTDTDNDTVDDQTEGTADTDDDGIPDYLDNIALSNVLPQAADETRSYLVECDPGVRCRLGQFALMGEAGGAQLSEDDVNQQEDLLPDPSFEPVGGIFDFEVRDLPQPGQSVQVVAPQRAPIPAGAVYRKFQGGEWMTFVENDNNALHSAAGNPGYCPPPGDEAWEAGLVPGHLCVQLTVEDGGPNDADGLVNSAVEDPGAVSVPVEVPPEEPGTPEEPNVPEEPEQPTEETIVRGIKSTGGGGAVSAFFLIFLGGMMMVVRCARRGTHKVVAASAKRGLLPLLLIAALWVPAQPLKAEIATDSVTVEFGLYNSDSSGSANGFASDMAADGVTVDIERYDTSRLAQQFAVGYYFRPWAGVQVGYLDLGDVDVDIQAQAADVETLRAAFIRHYPATGDGWTLSYRYQYPVTGSVNVTADIGAFAWSRDIDVFKEAVGSADDNGVDPVLALGVNYEMTEGFSVGGRLQRAYVEDASADLWGAVLTWHF